MNKLIEIILKTQRNIIDQQIQIYRNKTINFESDHSIEILIDWMIDWFIDWSSYEYFCIYWIICISFNKSLLTT